MKWILWIGTLNFFVLLFLKESRRIRRNFLQKYNWSERALIMTSIIIVALVYLPPSGLIVLGYWLGEETRNEMVLLCVWGIAVVWTGIGYILTTRRHSLPG